MGKAFIFAVIAIILCSGFFAFLYFYYEKPQQTTENFVNLSIYAVEKGSNEKIIVGYKIFVNGILYSEGETLKDGAILEQVLANSSIRIKSLNLKDQEYYQFSNEFYTSFVENKRIVIELVRPQEIIINHAGILGYEKINVSIKANETIKAKICLSYSLHFIYLKTDLIRTDNVDGFDKCYNAIIDDFFNFQLSYETFGELNSRDKISIAVFDRSIEEYEDDDLKPQIYDVEYE